MLSATLQDGLSDYEIGARFGRCAEEEDGARRAGQHTGLSRRCCRRSSAAGCSPRCRRCCASRWSSASASSSSSLARARSRSSRSCGRASACNCPSGPARATCLTGSNRSTIRQPSGGSTAYYAEFLPVAPEKLRPHDHPGVEFIYVLQGALSVHIGERNSARAGRRHVLRLDHSARYRRSGGRRVQRHRRDGRMTDAPWRTLVKARTIPRG